jgi:hypothetical protein
VILKLVDLPPKMFPPEATTPGAQSLNLSSRLLVWPCAGCVPTEFELNRMGRPRLYCWVCEPAGWQIVKVPHQSRVKLRRRPPLFPRMPKINKGVSVASVVPLRDESA